MVVVLLLGACVFPENDEVVEPLPAATASPAGGEVPTNVAPWVMLPVRRPLPGMVAPPRAASHRDVKIVDRRGKEVPVRRTQEELAAATWLRLEPRAPLPANSEFRLVAPGAVMVSFSTSAEADGRPPEGGALHAWTWAADPACPAIVLRYGPVTDASPVSWEVDAVSVGDPAARLRAMGAGDPTATAESAVLTLRDCVAGNAIIPRGDIDLQLRWVDLAGNAGPWSGPVRIPTSLPYAGESVPRTVSAW